MAVFKKERPKTLHAVINELVERVNSNIQRLRVLEQSSDSVVTRTNSLEQNYLQLKKDLQKQISEINKSISKLDERITKIETTLKEVIEYVKKLPTTSKIKELEEMIEIYNPIASKFVTKEEVLSLMKKNNK